MNENIDDNEKNKSIRMINHLQLVRSEIKGSINEKQMIFSIAKSMDVEKRCIEHDDLPMHRYRMNREKHLILSNDH